MFKNDKELKEIRVESYSGYKANEKLKRIIIDGEKIVVIGIIRKYIEENYSSRERREVFHVECDDGTVKVIYHYLRGDYWYIGQD